MSWMSWNVKFHEIIFQKAFYLEKQKSFIPKKKYNLGQESSYRWRFAVPIFQEGFDTYFHSLK